MTQTCRVLFLTVCKIACNILHYFPAGHSIGCILAV